MMRNHNACNSAAKYSKKKCILCGGEPDVIGTVVPGDEVILRIIYPSPALVRQIFYFACTKCVIQPGSQQRIEQIIIEFHEQADRKSHNS